MNVEVAKPTSTERIEAALNELVEAVRTRALKWRRSGRTALRWSFGEVLEVALDLKSLNLPPAHVA